MTAHISYHNLKKKKDNRRIWLEGAALLDCGFAPGDFFSLSLNIDNLNVVIKHIPDSPEARRRHAKKEIRKVSRRKCVGWVKPIIDICNAGITSLFGEFCRFKAELTPGVVQFGIHPEDLARAKREQRFIDNVKKGTITKGDAFLGFGIKSDAIAEGFKSEGVNTEQKWVIELESRYLDIAKLNSPERYKNTRMFCGYIEEVEKHLLEPVDSFNFSMQCTNHSLTGKTKKKLKTAEMGDEVTALFGVVETIKAVNPAVLFSENVPQAQDSATYQILTKELERLGYNCKHLILDEKHGGCLELRKRYWLVAYSKGLSINADSLIPQPIEKDVATFGAIKDNNISDDAWHDVNKLYAREEKNKEEGRNFSTSFVTDESESVNTIPRTYARHQVSNPHVLSPCGKFYRLFSKFEHAAVKRVPVRLINYCSATVAHEGLGQGVSYLQPFGLAKTFIRNLSLTKNQQALSF